jgi:hypothetical protein
LNPKLLVAGVLGAAALAAPAVAHHSFAMFDSTKEMVLQGVVKEYQWTNPHTWIQLNVKDDRGRTVEWAIEGSSPNGLARRGWKRTTLKAGDKISVKIRPLKSGEKGGSFVSATFADGAVVGGANSANAPPTTPGATP